MRYSLATVVCVSAISVAGLFAGGCSGRGLALPTPVDASVFDAPPVASYSNGPLFAPNRMSVEIGTAYHGFSGVYGLHVETAFKTAETAGIVVTVDREWDTNPDAVERGSDWDVDLTTIGVAVELIPALEKGLGGFVLGLGLAHVRMDSNTDDHEVTEGARLWADAKIGYRILMGYFVLDFAGRASGGRPLEVEDDDQNRLQHILDASLLVSMGVAF